MHSMDVGQILSSIAAKDSEISRGVDAAGRRTQSWDWTRVSEDNLTRESDAAQRPA